ncbi:hypothetical protein STRTUCAR8_00556 [Streptomyces turgidiscabies Car8]|uniref:Uncharacterized protein n=1 Tax=Streptomyces turgidiscabies (strain Car8) TaxID=698760 RepID=L7EUB8_STRT8|nr:hypothetical protein STRTUCAR8_00556 [Streptomyces turgidiscabies Car8]
MLCCRTSLFRHTTLQMVKQAKHGWTVNPSAFRLRRSQIPARAR